MSELRFETKKIRVADLGKESCVPDLLGELTMQNSLEFHLDETDEIYEGYGRVKSAYPYRQRNTYTRELKEQEVQTGESLSKGGISSGIWRKIVGTLG